MTVGGQNVKTFTTLKAVLVVLIATAYCQSCYAQNYAWPGTTGNTSNSTIELGGKVFDRPGSDLGLPIAVDSVTNATLFDSNDATDLDGALGGEVKWTFDTHHGRTIEVRGQLARWEVERSVDGPNLSLPFFFPAFDPDSFDYAYDSQYASIEILARRPVANGFTLLGGFRYVSFNETVEFDSSTVFAFPGAPPVTVNTETVLDARNHMYGLEIGAEFNRQVTQDINLTSYIRVAALANPTRVEMSTFDDLSGATTTEEPSKATGTGLFEFGARANYAIVPGAANFFLGYEGTFIDGIALAPAQLVTEGLNGAVETTNTPYFGGLVFGFQYNY